jgi:hypothetical protein
MDVRADDGEVFIQAQASPAVHGELKEQITAIAHTFPEVKQVHVKLSRLLPYGSMALG